ncbi:Myb-related transcription factor, partner of profilin [Anabarilius grahami]|uniref:Myb-related transcription factor, partner of profilin n=1 Tax=Anabarilius grahami TaxID=495550 RepID=A0A3N0YRA0_ANAGA|nr:Myb-related transcription factor, partner of profilin [Anabarilius grahami]
MPYDCLCLAAGASFIKLCVDFILKVLLSEVEGRKKVLFGGLSAGISNKRKILEWEQVTEAVNAVTSVPRTVQETKKKWSDLKVVVKKRICAHRRSVGTTGGGQGITDLSAFDARVGAIIGETGLSGVLPEFQGDTDVICGDDGTVSPGMPSSPVSGPSGVDKGCRLRSYVTPPPPSCVPPPASCVPPPPSCVPPPASCVPPPPSCVPPPASCVPPPCAAILKCPSNPILCAIQCIIIIIIILCATTERW